MTLEKVLRWIALAGIFTLPFIVLIVARDLFFPFITGKNFTFRILVEIIGGAWLALAAVSSQYRPKHSWILYAFGAFVIVIGVADAFGVNPFKSFWSNYERMEGWVTLAHLFVYFAATFSLLTPELWRRWWNVSLGVSVLVGFYGLLQLAGLAVINQGGVRLDATLGNATYLAVYMLFHIFVASLFLVQEWVRRPASARATPTLIYGGIIVLDAIILFFTATRGAFLGLIGGAVLTLILLVITSRNASIAKGAGAALASVLVLIGMVWFARDTAVVQSIEPLARLTTISFLEISSQARFMNWGMAWQGVKERPILGWGQENYAAVFDKYYNPNMHGQEPWFDRVHQLFLDWLIAGGIVGLIAYLSIHAAALWTVWRSNAFTQLERSLVTGLLAGYVFYLMFTFDNIVSYLLFVSLLGYIASRAAASAPALMTRQLVPYKGFPIVALSAVVAVSGIAWSVNASPLAANKDIIQGLSPQQGGLAQNLEYFKKSIARGTFGTQEAREHLSQTASRVASPDISATPELRKAFFDTATSEMALQMQDSPLNARFPFFLGILQDTFGDHGNARTALQKAHELSPHKQSILMQLGLNAVARGDEKEAVEAFATAHHEAPAFVEAAVFYAAILISTGDITGADTVVGSLATKGRALDQRIVSAYVSQKRYDKVAEFAAIQNKAQPDNEQARFTEAAALYASGQVPEAVRVLEEVQRVFPQSAGAAAALLTQVKSGTLKIQ